MTFPYLKSATWILRLAFADPRKPQGLPRLPGDERPAGGLIVVSFPGTAPQCSSQPQTDLNPRSCKSVAAGPGPPACSAYDSKRFCTTSRSRSRGARSSSSAFSLATLPICSPDASSSSSCMASMDASMNSRSLNCASNSPPRLELSAPPSFSSARPFPLASALGCPSLCEATLNELWSSLSPRRMLRSRSTSSDGGRSSPPPCSAPSKSDSVDMNSLSAAAIASTASRCFSSSPKGLACSSTKPSSPSAATSNHSTASSGALGASLASKFATSSFGRFCARASSIR
mmetsp:Transcript_22674/g.72618  ORF Transcript_22674/g.72618 Transcript_22674/m.72618 type:complete len:287 (+) Transcript_22674:300-1160(+)